MSSDSFVIHMDAEDRDSIEGEFQDASPEPSAFDGRVLRGNEMPVNSSLLSNYRNIDSQNLDYATTPSDATTCIKVRSLSSNHHRHSGSGEGFHQDNGIRDGCDALLTLANAASQFSGNKDQYVTHQLATDSAFTHYQAEAENDHPPLIFHNRQQQQLTHTQREFRNSYQPSAVDAVGQKQEMIGNYLYSSDNPRLRCDQSYYPYQNKLQVIADNQLISRAYPNGHVNEANFETTCSNKGTNGP